MCVWYINVLLTRIHHGVVIVYLHDQEPLTTWSSYGVGHLLGIDKILLHVKEWIIDLFVVKIKCILKEQSFYTLNS